MSFRIWLSTAVNSFLLKRHTTLLPSQKNLWFSWPGMLLCMYIFLHLECISQGEFLFILQHPGQKSIKPYKDSPASLRPSFSHSTTYILSEWTGIFSLLLPNSIQPFGLKDTKRQGPCESQHIIGTQ